MSSSGPKPPRPNPNSVNPNSKPELVPRGLGLTLKSGRPLPSPIFVERSSPDQIERSKKLRERLSQPLIDKKIRSFWRFINGSNSINVVFIQ